MATSYQSALNKSRMFNLNNLMSNLKTETSKRETEMDMFKKIEKAEDTISSLFDKGYKDIEKEGKIGSFGDFLTKVGTLGSGGNPLLGAGLSALFSGGTAASQRDTMGDIVKALKQKQPEGENYLSKIYEEAISEAKIGKQSFDPLSAAVTSGIEDFLYRGMIKEGIGETPLQKLFNFDNLEMKDMPGKLSQLSWLFRPLLESQSKYRKY